MKNSAKIDLKFECENLENLNIYILNDNFYGFDEKIKLIGRMWLWWGYGDMDMDYLGYTCIHIYTYTQKYMQIKLSIKSSSGIRS